MVMVPMATVRGLTDWTSRHGELRGHGADPCPNGSRLSADAAGGREPLPDLAELRVLRHSSDERNRRPFDGARCGLDYLPAGPPPGSSRRPATARAQPELCAGDSLPGLAVAGRCLGLGEAAAPRFGRGSTPGGVRAGVPPRPASARARRTV